MMSIKQHPSRPVDLSIDHVRQRLARWRRTRQKGSRIPEPLWKAAVQVARSYGLNPTARALRLDYYDLQKRLEAAADPDPVGTSSLASFVELVAAGGPTGPAPSPVPECLVELESPRGGKLRIALKGTPVPDLGVLGRLFWSGKP
jgi:hypothetical protein